MLADNQQEILFGGAAGGGKSEALLMAALQYAHVPGYSAIIFRRRYTQLMQASALIPRSHEWLNRKAHWNGTDKIWTIPTDDPDRPAVLKFGHLDHETSKHEYQGSEYQFFGFDELTQFTESQYTYLFSRARKRREGMIGEVPIRFRSTSNPGDIGHAWVKRRWGIANDGLSNTSTERLFIPSRIADNPSIDQEDYVQQLGELDPVTRQQLLHGIWAVFEGAKFKQDWLRYYRVLERSDGDFLIPINPDGEEGRMIDPRKIRTVFTVDPAGTKRDVMASKTKGKTSWCVVQVWDVSDRSELFLRYVWRDKVEMPDVKAQIGRMHDRWKPQSIYIEADGIGRPLYQFCRNEGLPVRPITTAGKDKTVRAVPAQNRMEAGQVYLLDNRPTWSQFFEDQLLQWTGHPDEEDDDIDAFSYAAAYAVRPLKTIRKGSKVLSVQDAKKADVAGGMTGGVFGV